MRHDVVDHATVFSGIVERDDVRVAEPCGRGDLGKKSRASNRRGDLGTHDFYGNAPIVAQIARAVDSRHATAANFCFYVVCGADIRSGVDRVCHCGDAGRLRVPGPALADAELEVAALLGAG